MLHFMSLSIVIFCSNICNLYGSNSQKENKSWAKDSVGLIPKIPKKPQLSYFGTENFEQ